MSANLASILYLVSGVLFILALRGLSHPTTSRQGNLYGMVGMGIAILTTLFVSPPSGIGGWALVILGLGIGGGVGAVVAKRVPMTAMPQLVAAFQHVERPRLGFSAHKIHHGIYIVHLVLEACCRVVDYPPCSQ